MDVRGGFFLFSQGGFRLAKPEAWLRTIENPADGSELPLETPGAAPPPPVLKLQAVQSASFRDRVPLVVYVHGGEGGVAADPVRTLPYVILPPIAAPALTRFQPIVKQSFVETDASPRPLIVGARTPVELTVRIAPIIRRNTPDERASPPPVVVAARSQAPSTSPAIVVRGTEDPATATPRPVVVGGGLAALQVRLALAPPLVARGGPEEATAATRPVLAGQGLTAAAVAALAPFRPVVVRGAVELEIVVEPEAPRFVIGGRELPGARKKRRRKPDPPDDAAERSAAVLSDVKRITREAEDHHRSENLTEAQKTLAELRKNLRDLSDI
jgi:hypothetical protein